MTKPQFEHVFDDTPVLVAYLFGSHAVGRAGPESDYDIAVLCAPDAVLRELARAGKKVLVLERRPVVGGAAVTEEVFPGFRFFAPFVPVVALLCAVVVETPVRLTAKQKEILRELEDINRKDSTRHNPRAKSFMDKVREFFAG